MSKETKKGVVSTNAQGYGYKYLDLAGVHNYLADTHQSYYQFIDVIDGADYVMTQKLKINDKGEPELNGEPLRGSKVINATLSGKSNPAQEHGSALTYARRYSLYMAFGLATEDDDGEAMTQAKGAQPATEKKTNIDFAEEREKIANAESRAEVEAIFKAIPAPLQQYFIKDCEKRVKEIA